MGNFSRDTYSILKNPDAAGFVRDYRGVRLQMGVPLVDADWNELEDIRKHELRDLVRSVIGTGVPTVPAGNDGFALSVGSAQRAQAPDITITGGTMVVNGTLVTNPTTVDYTAQEYYAGNPAALQRANARGVTPVAVLTALPMPAPFFQFRVDTVYLEVWEREVNSQEDNRMMDNALLEETSVRLRLEWVVRVAENGAAVPASTATVTRTPLAAITYVIYPINGPVTSSVQDLRRRGLSLDSLVEQDRILTVAPVGVPRLNWFGNNPWYFADSLLYAMVPWGQTNSGGYLDIGVTLPHGARLSSLRIIGEKSGGTLAANFRAVALAAPYSSIELVPPQNWDTNINLHPLDVELALSAPHVVDVTTYKYVLTLWASVHRVNFISADEEIISGFQIRYRY